MTRPDQNEDHQSQRPAKNVVIEFSTGPPRFLWEESTPSHVETKTIDTDAHVNAVIDVESSPAPTRIANRYQIIGVLGTGGQATVYLAEDTTLRRKVAIKISKPDWALSVHQQEQFKREAQAIAALKHPGIVTVHDFGIHDDGRCFIVLEYLPGQSLKDCLKDPEKRKAFTIERTLQLIRQVAEALHYAHHSGIYHRDLKPGNILLDEHGNPHITDFGLAVTEETQRGLKGQVAGTIPYMAPEQVRGEAHWLNGQADIWALGVILYEMLGGRRPFVGASEEEVKEQILCRTAVPLRQLDDQIPEEIERACIRCLTRDLQVRFSTAQEVSHSLVPKASKEMPARSATFERLWSRRILLYAAAVLIISLLAAFLLPVVMRKSKALVVDRWNDVSDVSPEQLAWNSKKEESRWHYDPATKVVEFKTDEFGLLRFGTIQFQDFDLQAQLSQASLRTDESWGLFFGLHPKNVNGKELQEFQGLVLGSNDREDIPKTLDRVFVRYEIDSAAPPQQFKFSPAKVAPRDLEWLTLEVQVRTGRVNKILVNGKLVGPRKDDPAEAMMARMSAQEFLPCTGPFGIYCYGSGHGFSGMCRNMKIRPLTSNVVSNQHKENAHGDH